MSAFSLELEHYTIAQSLNLHSSIVRAVDCSDALLLSSGLDGSTYLYSLESDRYSLVQAYQHHEGAVYACRFAPDPTYFFTGGGDKKVICSDLEGSKQVNYLGHEDAVCSVDVVGNRLISGSWDATGRLWDIETQQCIAVLPKNQHNYGVTVRGRTDAVLTGSQTGKLNMWSWQGNHLRSVQAHSDIIREIILIPNVGFATCSNDQTVKIWTDDCRLIQTLEGHRGYVFCLEVSSTGVLFSGSDDRTIRTWVDGQCTDTIDLPNSIWSLRVNPNSDLIAACGDKEVHIFTKSHLREAPPAEQEAYHKQCEAAAQPAAETPQAGKYPSVQELATRKGKKDGAYELFNDNGKLFAFCWHEDGQFWEKIGEVESQAPAPAASSKFYPGDEVFPQGEYDYIFDVDFGDGRLLKLPYSNSQNPLEVAEKFVVREHLHREFIFQIESHINKNAKPSWNEPMVVAKTEVQSKYFPYLTPLLFDTVNMEPIVKKIVELNGTLQGTVVLDDGEVEQLGKLANTLGQKANYRSSSITRKDYLVINKLLTWPNPSMFPVFDLFRVLQLHPGAGELYKGSDQGAKVISPAVATLSQGSGPGLVTALRLLCNMFGDSTAMFAVQKRRQPILEAALTHIDSDSKPLRLSLATLLLNYSTLFMQREDTEGRVQILSAIVDFTQRETDEETLFRAFVTIGNLLAGGGVQTELVDLASNLGLGDVLNAKQTTPGRTGEIASELRRSLYR